MRMSKFEIQLDLVIQQVNILSQNGYSNEEIIQLIKDFYFHGI